jgi:hypothetical protein
MGGVEPIGDLEITLLWQKCDTLVAAGFLDLFPLEIQIGVRNRADDFRLKRGPRR